MKYLDEVNKEMETSLKLIFYASMLRIANILNLDIWMQLGFLLSVGAMITLVAGCAITLLVFLFVVHWLLGVTVLGAIGIWFLCQYAIDHRYMIENEYNKLREQKCH